MPDSLISVVMSAYNAESTIEMSLRSIVDQSYVDWELIIIDDGSSDGTWSVANRFAVGDKRIRVYRNEENRGLVYSLNRALGFARGAFIARQDADDISMPERFALQMEFLASHPRIGFVSTGMVLFDEFGDWGCVTNPAFPVVRDFVGGSPFAHAASMSRATVLAAVGGYRDLWRTERVEDYDLWFRIYERGELGANLPQALYHVRDDRAAQGRRRFRYRINESLVKLEGFLRLGIPVRFFPWIIRPVLIGLLPASMYKRLRRARLSFARVEA